MDTEEHEKLASCGGTKRRVGEMRSVETRSGMMRREDIPRDETETDEARGWAGKGSVVES